MKSFNKLTVILGAACILFSQSLAAQSATTLDVSLTVDNIYTLSVSTSATTVGTVIGTDSNWPDAETYPDIPLSAGVTNYIHVQASNEGGSGNPAAFLAELMLSDDLFKFPNGTQSLLTNTTDGWLAGAVAPAAATPVKIGDHGDTPWGVIPPISTDADWIWLDAVGETQTQAVHFTVAVEPTVADINIFDATENSDDPVIAGSGADNIDFSFTASNDGPDAASGVVFNMAVDWSIDIEGFINCTLLPGGYTSDVTGPATSFNLIWPAMELAVDEEVDFSMTCTVDSSATHGNVFTAALSVEAVDQIDDDLTNDSATLDATINREAVINVTKTWGDSGGGEVDLMLTCNDVLADSATTSGLAASFTLSDFDDVTNCVVTEVVPAGYAPVYTGCSAEPVVSGMTYECGIANDVSSATFAVSKQFSDGNTDPVTVTLTCNGGLPLQQSFEISDGNPVTFTVKSFIDGEVDCEVTEEGTAGGYTPSFDNGTVVNQISCEYIDVTSTAHTCTIFNAADAGLYTVGVEWILPEIIGVEEDYSVAVTISCDADIFAIDDTALPPSTQSITVSLDDGDSVVLKVDTAVGAMCSAEQEIVQSGVEPEASAGCTDAELTAGGSAECVFTNTVFYEGIPTLSQYGMALLALLMLSVGFVGFRRFI